MAGFRDAMARRLERGRVDTGVLRDVMAKDAYEKCHLRGSGRGRPLSAMSGGQLLGHKGDSATEVPLNNWELIRLGDGRSLRGN